jgi:hypothetical protein
MIEKKRYVTGILNILPPFHCPPEGYGHSTESLHIGADAIAAEVINMREQVAKLNDLLDDPAIQVCLDLVGSVHNDDEPAICALIRYCANLDRSLDTLDSFLALDSDGVLEEEKKSAKADEVLDAIRKRTGRCSLHRKNSCPTEACVAESDERFIAEVKVKAEEKEEEPITLGEAFGFLNEKLREINDDFMSDRRD